MRLTLAQLWSVLDDPAGPLGPPDFGTRLGDWKAVYDAFHQYAVNHPLELSASDLEDRFKRAGYYDDLTHGPASRLSFNGLYDPGEILGQTSWVNSKGQLEGRWHRRARPPQAGSYVLFTVQDGAGRIQGDVTFRIAESYPPPLSRHNKTYYQYGAGVGPQGLSVHVPPGASHISIVAQKAGLPDSAPLVITAEFFWNSLNPLRPGGVTPILLEHTFALAAPGADLAAQATVQPGVAPVGATLTYTSIVTNAGPVAATAVRVTNVFNGPVTLGAVVASQGSCSPAGTAVTCELGNLGPGADAVITIQVMSTNIGNVSNTFSVGASEPDPAPANNLLSVAATVVARPELRFVPTPNGAGLELSWPANGASVVIESTDRLAPPIVWRSLEVSPTPVGDWLAVTVPAPSGTRFFRLRYP
jgi:uncharacterized repeat protein (TIGR01451 family)